MEELNVLFEKRLQKIDDLNKAMVLMTEKSKYILELKQLKQNDCKENALLLVQCKESINEFKNVVMPQCKELITKTQEIQLDALHVLTELDRRSTMQAEPKPTKIQTINKKTTPISIRKLSTRKQFSMGNKENNESPNNYPMEVEESAMKSNTRRMLLSDYKDSPFVRRRKVPQLQFIDFDATIDQQMFNSIPTYMKGRDTMEELNHFLNHTIIKCFTDKYTLAMKERSAITNQHEINLWKLYFTQSEYFPGKKFITQGDLSTMTQKLLDRKTSNRIQMLRHVQILREERKNTTICYIWTKN